MGRVTSPANLKDHCEWRQLKSLPTRTRSWRRSLSRLRQWWGQKGLYRVMEHKADLRPGGKWSGTGVSADGKPFQVDGEYLEIEPPRLLVYTWNPSFAHLLKTTVRCELEPRDVHGLQHSGPHRVGTGTLVKIRQEGFAGNLEQAQGHSRGWTLVLGWMQAYVERGETVDTRTE